MADIIKRFDYEPLLNNTFLKTSKINVNINKKLYNDKTNYYDFMRKDYEQEAPLPRDYDIDLPITDQRLNLFVDDEKEKSKILQIALNKELILPVLDEQGNPQTSQDNMNIIKRPYRFEEVLYNYKILIKYALEYLNSLQDTDFSRYPEYNLMLELLTGKQPITYMKDDIEQPIDNIIDEIKEDEIKEDDINEIAVKLKPYREVIDEMNDEMLKNILKKLFNMLYTISYKLPNSIEARRLETRQFLIENMKHYTSNILFVFLSQTFNYIDRTNIRITEATSGLVKSGFTYVLTNIKKSTEELFYSTLISIPYYIFGIELIEEDIGTILDKYSQNPIPSNFNMSNITSKASQIIKDNDNYEEIKSIVDNIENLIKENERLKKELERRDGKSKPSIMVFDLLKIIIYQKYKVEIKSTANILKYVDSITKNTVKLIEYSKWIPSYIEYSKELYESEIFKKETTMTSKLNLQIFIKWATRVANFIDTPLTYIMWKFRTTTKFTPWYGYPFGKPTGEWVRRYKGVWNFIWRPKQVPKSYWNKYAIRWDIQAPKTMNTWKWLARSKILFKTVLLISFNAVSIIYERYQRTGKLEPIEIEKMVKDIYENFKVSGHMVVRTAEKFIELISLIVGFICYIVYHTFNISVTVLKKGFEMGFAFILDKQIEYDHSEQEQLEPPILMDRFDFSMAKVCEIAYQNKTDRPRLLPLNTPDGDKDFYLDIKYSSNFIALYESGNHIVIGVRGVNSILELTEMAVIPTFNILTSNIKALQNLLDKTINMSLLKRKTVYITGHSKGAFIASKSISKFDNLPVQKLVGVLFSMPYGISNIGDWVHLDNTLKNERIKKISFLQDWVSNRIVKFKQRKNIILFNNPEYSFAKSHNIKTFTNQEINKYVLPLNNKKSYDIIKDREGKYTLSRK
jgi:hypothetical protein